MKKVYTVLMSLLSAAVMSAQTSVTLTVDITGAGLTPSPNGVHVAGSFGDPNYDGSVINAAYPNWDPAGIAMTDMGGGLYSVTLSLMPEHYEFKFVNGNGWDGVEDVPNLCQVEFNGNDNRFIDVGNDPTSYEVCYASCAQCGSGAVYFRVDMSLVDADGDGIPGEVNEDINPAGVFLAGNFNDPNYDGSVINAAYPNWDPAGIQLTALGNGIYGKMLYLQPAMYNFKYVNGNAWGYDEQPSGACTSNGNRFQDVTGGSNILTDAVCFGACSSCVLPTAVTFRVNMTNETVSPNGVHLAGSLQGWNPGDAAWELTDLDGDMIYEVTKDVQPGTYQYKFVNGNAWSGADNFNESLPAECNVGGNRSIDVSGPAMTVEFCYNQCTSGCVINPNPAPVTFQVNCANLVSQGVVVGPVWMITGASNPVWQGGATELTDGDGDGIYTGTLTIDGPAQFQYKFMNGPDVFNPVTEEGQGLANNCGVENGVGGFNRVFTRSGFAETIDVVCFDVCGNCVGCTDPQACNYNSVATVDDASCLIIGNACDDNNANTTLDMVTDQCVCAGVIVVNGCTEPTACNFNSNANVEDGSCILVGDPCDDGNPDTQDDVILADCSCNGAVLTINGCMNAAACNYNPSATQDDGSCVVPGDACDDNNANTINDVITVNCNCLGEQMVMGCMDSTACNYNALANMADVCVLVGDACDDGDSLTVNDVITAECGCAGTVGVYENMAFQSVLAYPNPTDNQLNLILHAATAQTVQVRVMNALGQFVQVEKFNQVLAGRNVLTMDVSKFENGIYLFEIQGVDGVTTVRVAVK